VNDEIQRPDDDDYDLLTVGEAGARLETEIAAGRRRLDELEQRVAYIGESTEVAEQIAAVERRLEDLQAAAQRIAGPADDRYTAAIERNSQLLETLEERFAYIAEDTGLASEIAEVERRLEALRQARLRAGQPADERVAADIAEKSQQLEALEERFAYIAEDPVLAGRIAELEAQLEVLRGGSTRPGSEDAAS
jgi:chromosome segregation ATPase